MSRGKARRGKAAKKRAMISALRSVVATGTEVPQSVHDYLAEVERSKRGKAKWKDPTAYRQSAAPVYPLRVIYSAPRKEAPVTPAPAPKPVEIRYGDPRVKAFYASRAWKEARYDALAASSGRCGCCGASPAIGALLNVDHIQPLRKRWDLRLTPSNLQVLCAACNQGKGNRDSTRWGDGRWAAEDDPLTAEYAAIMRG